MELAVEKTLDALRSQGLIHAEHEALVQLCRELARTISAGAPFGKTSVPQAAQQLMAALDALPKPPEAPMVDDPIAEAMRDELDGGQ